MHVAMHVGYTAKSSRSHFPGPMEICTSDVINVSWSGLLNSDALVSSHEVDTSKLALSRFVHRLISFLEHTSILSSGQAWCNSPSRFRASHQMTPRSVMATFFGILPQIAQYPCCLPRTAQRSAGLDANVRSLTIILIRSCMGSGLNRQTKVSMLNEPQRHCS